MHLSKVTLLHEVYPTDEYYPFNLPVLRETRQVQFTTPVTLFVGENGAGKSTLLRATAERCGIHIWEESGRTRYEHNPYEGLLSRCLHPEWTDGSVPGSYFGSDVFNHFTKVLDEWAVDDPGQLRYLGGESLVSKSHGQSLMAYFQARYKIRGIYFMDEPETALSPATQLQLLRLLVEMGRAGHAQFVIATHSPILLACPGARIFTFDRSPIQPIEYEQTDHYRIYRDFMANRGEFLRELE